MPVTSTFLTNRINATQALIEAYETALLGITTGTVESYTLDTGQSRQTVTKANIAVLNKALDGLYNRYIMLCQRRDGPGGGSMIGRPCF